MSSRAYAMSYVHACVAACCSILQYDATCCCVLQRTLYHEREQRVRALRAQFRQEVFQTTHVYLRERVYVCVCMCVCVRARAHVWVSVCLCVSKYVWRVDQRHDLVICGTQVYSYVWLIHRCDSCVFICVLIYMCDASICATHGNAWLIHECDSFVCVTCSYVWFIHVCDSFICVTHSYVKHMYIYVYD
jgi:hypothetical protein